MGEDSKSTPRKHLSWQYIINAAVIASANPTANCNMNQFFLSIMCDSHGGHNSVLDPHGRSGFVILQYCSAIDSQLGELGSELSIVLKVL